MIRSRSLVSYLDLRDIFLGQFRDVGWSTIFKTALQKLFRTSSGILHPNCKKPWHGGAPATIFVPRKLCPAIKSQTSA